LGTAAEAQSGAPLSTVVAPNSLDLTPRDVAAVADGFASITIGRSGAGNKMRIGDAYDMTIVKATGIPRVQNAEVKDEITLWAETFVVEGDFRVPENPLTLHGRTLEVMRANLHTPENATPDSGLSSTRTVVDVTEQAVVSGWILGDDLVEIHVPNSTGQNAIMNFSSGPNSLWTGVGSRIMTQNDGSRIDITGTGSILHASTVEAAGAGSQLVMTAGTTFLQREGGVLRVTGNESQMVIGGGTYLGIEAGSAVLAGVAFQMQGSTPVPVSTGTNSRLTLSAPGEMWLAGSVSSTGSMELNAGLKQYDHAEYFDTLPGRLRATTEPISSAVTELQDNIFPEELRTLFTINSLPLGTSVTLTELEQDRRWLATDENQVRYVIYLADADNDEELDAIQVRDPHFLIGQRGFSFLVTGTLTVMEPDRALTLQATDDVLIRGNLNLLGTGSDLVLQSDKWVYLESELQVGGDITIYGGVELDGTSRGGSGINGTSVLIPATSRLLATGAGSQIDVRGAMDVDVLGAIVAGGTVNESGATWAGPDGNVNIQAGQQLYIDTGVLASGSVSVRGGSAGADDNGLSVLITTAGGITAAGQTTGTTGGVVEVRSVGDIQMQGTIVSGGTMQQQFNANGDRIGETFNWSPKPSSIVVAATDGQAWIGGMARTSSGTLAETGGNLWTTERIEVLGGVNSQGVGVRISAASRVVAVNPSASIFMDSAGDADLQGSIVAGGTITRTWDATGGFLGSTVTTYDGDSTLRVQADSQIRLGRDLRAGKSIDLVGGLDPVEPGVEYSGNGILQSGFVQLSTWRPNSEINLNAPGKISILAPAYTQEIRAEGFIATANGRLDQNVVLSLWLSKVDFDIAAQVTIPAATTSTNTSIQDLLADIQGALNAATWKVVRTDNSSYPLNSDYTFDGAAPDLVPQLADSRIVLTSSYKHRLQSDSVAANLLGFTSTGADRSSSLPYALLADQPGSVIRIGAPAGPNGKLYIAGKVLADSKIELYSGAPNQGAAPDTVYVELEATGLLETVNGSISLSPGARTVLWGNVIAGGASSDVTLTAGESIDLRGSLTAGRSILVSAGSSVVPGTESIRTYGTSKLKSTHGGEIRITGVNDVVINSVIGTDSVHLSLIQLESSSGKLLIARESGRIETETQLNFTGHSLEIAGIVKSTRSTPDPDDYEVRIEITGTAELHGDMQLAGALLLKSGGLDIYNQTLITSTPGHKYRLESTGSITLGRTVTGDDGVKQQQGVVIGASSLEIIAGGALTINPGSVLFATDAGAVMKLQAGSAVIAGTLYAGAELDSSRLPVWVAPGAASLVVD
ncbi:MAG: hypothetical protein ACK524_20300, partial [Planctomyces sp.]